MGQHIGKQIGNYRLLRLLGRGGFAEVYLGEHLYLKNHVALKLVHATMKKEEQDVFLREAQLLARLTHPHIVRVLDFALEGEIPFLVMDYLPGGSIRQLYEKGARLPLSVSVTYLQQLASALQYAHNHQIIHRDVKPENLLLNVQQELVLSDFGLAVLMTHSNSYSTHALAQQVAGTSLYLAPEQLQGHAEFASDQYALAVVVYEWLCGRTPFEGTAIEIAMQHLSVPPPSLRERVADIPSDLEAVILRGLHKDPGQRFATVQAFADAFEQASQGVASPLFTSFPHRPLSSDNSSLQGSSLRSTGSEPLWKVPTLFTSLIGREQEVVAIGELLKQPEVRLLTLLGAGGIGKTRLSIQVATHMRHFFVDGVCFVALASLRDHILVIPAIAEALEIREIGIQSLFDQVKLSLRERHLLLILDNFEQVAGAAMEIEELLDACLSLKILVTSRAVLQLHNEQEFPVSPLALPNLKHLPTSEALLKYGAVALFVQRARMAHPSFHLNPANAHLIAEICVRLDGLPLAIELAAARVKLLPLPTLLARLNHLLQTLTGGARSLPTRQQTLRNTLKWSYDLLDADEQRLFRQIAVFVGGWTFEAVEAMLNVMHVSDTATVSLLDGLTSLMNKSLLLQVEPEKGEPRLQMLTTVREYGLEQLHLSSEADHVQQAHALYYLSLAEAMVAMLKSIHQVGALIQLELELENLRAALQWFIDQGEDEHALRFTAALWRFWALRGYWSEGRRWMEFVIALPSMSDQSAIQATVFNGAGELLSNLASYDAASDLFKKSLERYQKLQEKTGMAQAMSGLGLNLFKQGNIDVALKLLEQSVQIARESADAWTLASTLLRWGQSLASLNEFESALAPLEECVLLCRDVGDKHLLSLSLCFLSVSQVFTHHSGRELALAEESLKLARELGNTPNITQALYHLAVVKSFQKDGYILGKVDLQEALAGAREMGDKSMLARILFNLGEFNLYLQNLDEAEEVTQESLTFMRQLGNSANIVTSLSILGDVKVAQGDTATARALYLEGLALARSIGARKNRFGWILFGLVKVALAEKQHKHAAQLFGAMTFWLDPDLDLDPTQRANYEDVKAQMIRLLSESVFISAWQEGQKMVPEEALIVAEQMSEPKPVAALSQSPEAKLNVFASSYPDDLTAREVEVLRCVAQGLTDIQIGEQLTISPRTVNAHLNSIYRKIQVSSRAAATRYAMEHHLV